MDEMGHISQGLKRDLGAVKGAAAGGTAGLQLLGAALFSLGLRFVRVLAAARLVEHILDCGRQRTHSSLLSTERLAERPTTNFAFGRSALPPVPVHRNGGEAVVATILSG